MKLFLRIIMAAAIITMFIPAAAYAETLEEHLNNLVGPKQQYSTMLSSAYLKNNSSEASVNPQSGDLTLEQTDYVLPGRNGLDLEIKRIYKSGISNVHEMKTYYNYGAMVDYIYSDERTSSFYEDRYNLGIGMRFSFPAIEERKNLDGSSYKYLHTESGEVYRMETPTWAGVYPLENHTVKDIEIKEDSGYTNDQPDGISKYVMVDKSGKKTYFSSNGRILGIVDRYGNTIKFEYSDLVYTVNGITTQKRLISKITDALGRVVSIEYKEDHTLIIPRNSDGTYPGDLQGKIQVIIYLPDGTPGDLTDNKKIVYDKSMVLGCFIPGTSNLYPTRARIQWVYDIDNSIKYKFWFEQPYLGFTFTNGSYYSVYNRYENLNQIDYYKTNKLKRYVYGTYVKKLNNNGSMQYRKVIEERDLAKTGLDESQAFNEFGDKNVCELKNKISYVYTNEPDGYNYPGYNGSDQSYLKNTYRYSTELTDMRGAKTKYTYDGLGEAVNVENSGDNHKEVYVTTYDSNKLPQKKTRTIYNVVNGQVSGNSVTKIENYTYDLYGNLTSYTDPLGIRDSNGNPIVNGEHTVTYTYATDKFHILTSKVWKKDSATTSRIDYEVDANGNVTRQKNTHFENGADKSIITDFEYDTRGNIIKKTVNSTNSTYVTSYEYGVDADNTDHQGAYLTREYSTVDGTEISKKYVYDFMTGNMKAAIDEKGNRTNYEYDNLERVIKVTYPDSSTKQYQYQNNYYSDIEIWYIDLKGNFFSYVYDIFGNLVRYSVWGVGGANWTALQKIEYDSNGNKIEETDVNGHSTRYQYDSANRLVRKSFWENDTTEKKFLTLSYTVGYDTSTPLLVKLTDEEGYGKKYSYDLFERLVKLETMQNSGIAYYAKTYAYDYVGNKISETDENSKTSRYSYDDLNRLISVEKPVNISQTAVTNYKYNEIGKLVEEKDPRDKITYYEYDALGRLIRKKMPSGNGSHAIVRYVYDAAGNKIKEIAPNDYVQSSDNSTGVMSMKGTEYGYDSMNRLIWVKSPEGSTIEYRSYDVSGNVKKVVDGLRYNGNIDTSPGTSCEYDWGNRVTKVTDALNNSVSNQYRTDGKLYKSTDARGYETQYEYYSDGNLWKVTYPDTGVVEYTYDKLGHKLTEKNQLGRVTTYTYNGYGQVKTVTDAKGNKVEYEYNPDGTTKSVKDARGSYTNFYYYDDGKLKQKDVPIEKDSSGNIIYANQINEYNKAGNLTKQTLTGTKDTTSKREISYTYYDNNLVNTVTDSSGAYAKSCYDSNGNVIKVEKLKDGTSNYDVSKFEYDRMGRMVKSIKLINESDVYNAESLPDIASLRDSEYPGKIKLITGFEYDILGNRTKSIDSRAYGYLSTDTANRDKYTVRYSYDALNRLNTVTRKHNGSDVYTKYYYDAAGNKKVVRDDKGNYTVYTYDNMGRLTAASDPETDTSLKTATTLQVGTYAKNETNSLKKTFVYEYDKAGNRIWVTNAKGCKMKTDYDELNRVDKVYAPYDPDKTDSETNPHNRVTSKKVYDANGNLVKDIDAKGYADGTTDDTRYGTIYTYDMANRCVSVLDPVAKDKGLAYTTKFEFNQYGQKTKATDALGNSTIYEYDSAGRLKKVTDATSNTTSFAYDKAGNKLNMTNGRGKVTSYGYGSFGLLLSVTDADQKSASYKYNLAGNAARAVDRNGNETLFSYSPMNMLLSKSVTQTGESISYTYDALGNRVSMTDATGTLTYEYDSNNRLKNIKKAGVSQIAYTYDIMGNIETVTDKKGFVTSYKYDQANRMLSVSYTVGGGSKTTTYHYDINGNRDQVTYSDGGVTESYTFDKNNRLLTLTNKKPDGIEVISAYSYTYSSNGLQDSKTDSYGQTKYTYDAAGSRQSLKETYESSQSTGIVDGVTGSQIQYKVKTSQYVYSDANKLLRLTESMTDASGKEVLKKIISYTYDNNGNQIKQSTSYIKPISPAPQEQYGAYIVSSSPSTDGQVDSKVETTFNQFDGFNRLKKVDATKDGKRTITEFAYNGNDLRVSKTVKRSTNNYAAEVTNYLYDRQHVILETDGSDNLKVRYVKGINYIARVDASNKLSFFLYNGHGDVVQTVTEAGVVENQYDYDIFGEPTLATEVGYSCAIRYAGEFYDVETGLYYLRARYYDPDTGRFVSEDSYWGEDENPLSLNLYTYCHNDPINFTDPSGHWEKGDENLNYDARVKLSRFTDMYFGATTDKERAAIHDQAKAIRNDPANKATTPQNSVTGDAVNKVLANKEYMSKSDWHSISTTKSDKVVTNALADNKITASEIIAVAQSKPSNSGSGSGSSSSGNGSSGTSSQPYETGVGAYPSKQPYEAGVGAYTGVQLEDKDSGVQNVDAVSGASVRIKIDVLKIVDDTMEGMAAMDAITSSSTTVDPFPIDKGMKLSGMIYVGIKGTIKAEADDVAEVTGKAIAKGTLKSGVLDNANFAQKTYGSTFSKDGIKIYSDLAGKPINTVDDLASALKNGTIKPSDVPIDYIVRDGNTLILNTRSSQALTQAGIPRSQWNAVNQTGNQLFEDMLTGQLSRNGLTSAGTPTVRMSGGNK